MIGTRTIARAVPGLTAQIAAFDFRQGAVALPNLLRQQPPWLNAVNRRMRWGDVTLGEICAAGSTATVRKAELMSGSEVSVAVKVYKRADEQAMYSFVSELFAYLLLSSSSVDACPFIPSFHGYILPAQDCSNSVDTLDTFGIVISYCPHRVEDRLRSLSTLERKELALQLGRALLFLNEAELFCCDVGFPDNSMVSSSGNLRLVDFGNVSELNVSPHFSDDNPECEGVHREAFYREVLCSSVSRWCVDVSRQMSYGGRLGWETVSLEHTSLGELVRQIERAVV